MSRPAVPIRVHPSGKTIQAAPGVRLLEALADAGLVLDAPCGGEGLCGKCRVVVHEGADPPNAAERNALSDADIQTGLRLACQTPVTAPLKVEIPEKSRLAAFHQILAETSPGAAFEPDAVVRKRYVELPIPGRGDEVGDQVRLKRAIGPYEAELDVARRLPGQLRADRFRGTAVLAGPHLLAFEPGNTEGANYAVAVDVGTTTLVAVLIDLASGQDVAVASELNPQTRYGDDVLSRIQMAGTDGGLARLQQAVADAVQAMIERLASTARIGLESIYEVAFAGNTTMQHLLAGLDTRYLGEVPFVPSVQSSLALPARQIGLRIHPAGRAYLLPVIGGFVGGDTVAGMLATDLARRSGATLLVDIGTNGEIVLASGGKLYAAATAAGPAFEGARITHGMRACAGAIERVTFEDQLQIATIGEMPPLGLCGSALIDLAAILLDYGVISPEGRFRTRSQLPEDAPDDIRRRTCEDRDRMAFELASAHESGTGCAIVVNQADIRQLQLASGAIRAGIQLLTRRAGIQVGDLDELIVAGGFGNYIRRAKAQRIGLIPESVPCDRIRYGGNTSLAGARIVLLSGQKRAEAEELAARTEHIDLSTDQAFQWTFADAMIFPGGY
ncbi:MAG: ASKHA domain-containing protein [Thermoguttaceae bacterium]